MERMRQAAAELLELYDQDKDGKLSADEKTVMDRDLNDAEKKARLAREYMRIKAIDMDGDLVISPEEQANSQQRLRDDARKRIEAMQQQRARQMEKQQESKNPATAPAKTAPASAKTAPAPAPAPAKTAPAPAPAPAKTAPAPAPAKAAPAAE